ncbi:MAG: T9SS type A sorting domain-containing protein [Bacteroidota bacterium]
MRIQMILFTVLMNIYLFGDSLAQQMPLVYNVENTGADCPIPYFPTLSQLPYIQALPDPFAFADGSGRMTNFSDWRYRRVEIGAQIQNYEIGIKPAVDIPSQVTASYSGGDTAGSSGTLTVHVTVNGYTLTLTCPVSIPSGATAPYPVVIGMDSPYGSLSSSVFTSRGIAGVTFYESQVTSYGSPSNTDPYYRLYPNLNLTNTGQYSAWAWGVSRIIDGFELVQNVLSIDLKHIAVTGCSYAGKLALFAGAFDERVALTIAQESGGGGATSWRYSHSLPAGSVEDIDNTNYQWFMDAMSQFSGNNVSYLPEDHHELMAMCAPRALYVTANPPYVWLAGQSTYACSKACQTIYNALGIPDRFGFSIVGGHNHCAVPDSQLPEIAAFADKFLLGNNTVNTNIADTYYNSDLSSWITWTNPAFSNDTSYFTTLAYPPNNQTAVDTTNITFKWNKGKNALKYYIQLTTDPTFTTIFKSDSTTTDTSITYTGLKGTVKYYWRVMEKSASGLGPWSSVASFITTLALPNAPQLVSVVSNQFGAITMSCNKVNSATQYFFQVSNNSTFTNLFNSVTTTDTTAGLSHVSESREYYWRVQASNLAGSGQWSQVGNIDFLFPPSGLALTSGSNGIILNWTNNSLYETGNVIEREQSPQTTFTLLDTLVGTGSQYTDSQVQEGQTYTYRIKAYNTQSLQSSYCTPVSLIVTGVAKNGDGIPKEYSLSQNYPNPFNPTTKIKFALPQRALTKLIIYDLLGREIQTLINKELEAGYGEINFDASNFQTGVYFYRIQSGNFIQTKKMILMK